MATKFLIISHLLDQKKASQQFLISFLDLSCPEENTSCVEYILKWIRKWGLIAVL